MEYKTLGSTGLKVSRIALGTVELGLDYGFRGSKQYTRPGRREAIRILHRALDLGVNLIDTARTYGSSEELIGRALRAMRGRTMIASKVDISADDLAKTDVKRLRDKTLNSIDASLQALEIDTVDLMQIHDTSHEVLRSEEVLRALEDARQQGKIRFLGASCYGEQVALAAMQTSCFQVVQVPFNLLDRQLMTRFFPAAAERGIGVLARSIFLRGVLTSNFNAIPERLLPLKEAALTALEQCGDKVKSLSELALRFSLSQDEVTSVILGVRSLSELESNLADFEKGPLLPEQTRKLYKISLEDPSLLSPQKWADLI